MDRQFLATASNYYHHHHPHAYAPYAAAHQQHYHERALAPLAYRPLQLPLQHPAEQQQQQQHHQQQQQQLALAGFHNQNFRSQQTLPVRPRQQIRQQQTMMYHPDLSEDQEYAELQKLSNEYEPEISGPLVGQREPSTSITAEYASADPVFQAKTAALPQKYAYYRTVKGDGRCGWRAIAFGYFETLTHLSDSNKFLEEETRLRSLGNVLNAAGFSPVIYEDFAEEMFDLLRKVTHAAQEGSGTELLLESFNNEMLQNYVITYLKTLTAAWMKTRPSDYAPWLLGQTIDQYCDNSVMPIGSEIENVSLSALKDVLLSPAGIALEVLYLDRTEGSEVNMHRFDPVNHGGFTIGTIRLLYRPGHYDILYKAEDLPRHTTAVPTYLQYASHVHNEPVYDLGVSDFLTMLPGGSFVDPHQVWLSNSSYSGSDIFSAPTPVQQCVQAVPTPVAPAPQPQMQPRPVYISATPAQLLAPPTQMPQKMPIQTVSHASLSHPGFHHQLTGPFRPSAWELEPDFVQATSQMPFQTSIFRNSHFNTAHFLNPDFQPEEWHPDDEYVTTSNQRSRHRNSG